MKTMTRLENVEAKGSSVVVTLLGDKVAGTTDPELKAKLLEVFQRDPEHCLVNLEIDKRPDGKLWVTGVDYVEAPEELGGPAESSDPAPDGVDSTPPRADLPTPMTTLDDLLTLADRVEKIEQFLATKGYEA